MFTVNREELAWAAGFFDGEGHTTGKHGTVLQIGQTDPEVLYRFQKAVGGVGHIFGPYQKYSNTTGAKISPIWEYMCQNFQDTQAAIAMIWPFLSSIKREQAANTLVNAGKGHSTKKKHSKYRGVGFHVPSGKWRARTGTGYLGLYDTEDKAHQAILNFNEINL